VTYRVASAGSVVQETLFPGTPHEMISMYHLVDGELVLTHYCAMANQRGCASTARLRRPTASSSPSTAGRTSIREGHPRPRRGGGVEGGDLHAAWAVHSGGKETGKNEFVLTARSRARQGRCRWPVVISW